jgi:hypothetical protein
MGFADVFGHSRRPSLTLSVHISDKIHGIRTFVQFRHPETSSHAAGQRVLGLLHTENRSKCGQYSNRLTAIRIYHYFQPFTVLALRGTHLYSPAATAVAIQFIIISERLYETNSRSPKLPDWSCFLSPAKAHRTILPARFEPHVHRRPEKSRLRTVATPLIFPFGSSILALTADSAYTTGLFFLWTLEPME